MISSTLADDLSAIVGARHVLHRTGELFAYTADGLPGYRKLPSLAVFPGTREETIAVVRALARDGTPFVPRGAGTGLSGGALADGTVLLGLNRLNRILAIDADNRTATVEPGVVNAHLTRATARYGLHYAPDPSSQAACTIGGNVAENAGGPHCLKYGVTLNHVLEVTALLPNGDIVTLGSARAKLTRIRPAGSLRGVGGLLWGGTRCDGAIDARPAGHSRSSPTSPASTRPRAVSAIVASGIVPAALEMMDAGTIRAVIIGVCCRIPDRRCRRAPDRDRWPGRRTR
ncbi:MAG: FAD-binding protein [Gemmatimonadaceae bacterium]